MKALLSSKSKPWTIQNPAKVSISTQRIFMWTNPLEQKAKTAVWDKNRRFMYPDQRFAQNMGVSSAGETTIPEGTKREINGFAVVPLGINNPTEAITTLSTSCMILGLLMNTKRMGRADPFSGFSRWESRCSAARSWGLKLLT
jgi:hypothetical protein